MVWRDYSGSMSALASIEDHVQMDRRTLADMNEAAAAADASAYRRSDLLRLPG
jgi:uncharacterized membrane protein